MELLAHASAPSSRKDDERFKCQAKAYSTFRSATLIPIQRSQDVARSTISPVLKTPAAQPPRFESSVYLENTQDAYTALDSQLMTSSQPSEDDSNEDLSGDEDDDETILPLPVDSSLPPRHDPNFLPPNESSQAVDSSTRISRLPPSSAVPRSSRSHGQGNYVPSPFRPSELEPDVTKGYIGGLSTAEFLNKSSSKPPFLKTSKQELPEESLPSGDDIPSQLPSTYSLSDISSDPIHSDPAAPVSSSPWGSLPRGSAPQPWTGIIEEESPLKGLRSSGKRRVTAPSPLKQAQSSGAYRANTSAHVQAEKPTASSRQPSNSSPSLDRAFPRPRKSQEASLRQPSSLSFETRFFSSPQAQGTQPAIDDDANTLSRGKKRASSHRDLPSSFQSRFSSSPEAQGTQSIDASRVDASSVQSHKAPAQEALPSSFDTRFSSSPEAQGTQSPGGNNAGGSFQASLSFRSSGINLFAPDATNLTTDRSVASSSAADTRVQNVIQQPSTGVEPTHFSSDPLTSSFSKISMSLGSGNQSVTAADLSNPRVQKRTISAVIPVAALATKKRKYAAFSTPKTKPNTQERDALRSLSNQINPPPPATSSKSFKTHITSDLQKLWDDPKLKGRYAPIHVAREIRQSERGYWLIDTSSWAAAAQIKFWTFLESSIRPGLSGWGVWCLREDNDDMTGGVTSENKDDEQRELGTVKVFCWGEVVRHIWLLCYVASVCKLRNVESKWIDADGEVVVRI